MAKQKLFKSAFRGYNKKDVMTYIENLDIQAVNTKKELEGKIRELESQLEVLPQLKKDKQAYDELIIKHASLEKEKQDLESAVTALGQEHEQKVSMLESKISELSAQNALLEQQLEQAKEVQENFEEEKKELSQILESARNEAASLIEKAKTSAEKIIADAKHNASVQAQNIKNQSAELISTNLKKVKLLSRKKDELAQIIKDHKSKVDSLFSSISDKFKGEGR